MPAVRGGGGGQGAGAEGDGTDAGAVGQGGGEVGRARPVQKDGGQGAGQVRSGQCGPGGFLHGDGEVGQGAALQVGCEQSGGCERIPVGRPDPGAGRGVEQFAHLFGRHVARRPAAHGVGEVALLLCDGDAHTDACRLSDVPGRRRAIP